MIRLYKGDCLDIMKTIKDNSIDAIITDAPFGCNATMKGEYNDKEDYVKTQIPLWINEMYRTIKTGSYAFLYVPSLYLENWLIEVKKQFRLLNILAVENMKVGRQYKDRFRNNCQLILVLCKGKPKGFNKVDFTLTSKSWYNDKRNENPQKYTSTYPSYIPNYYKATVEKSVGHPDEKNHKLISKFIEMVTNENETVLDLFMGSGTTAVSCKNTNRNFIGIEQNETYFNIAQNRIKQKYE